MLFLSSAEGIFVFVLDLVNSFNLLVISMSATSYLVYFETCIRQNNSFNLRAQVVFYYISFMIDFNVYYYLPYFLQLRNIQIPLVNVFSFRLSVYKLILLNSFLSGSSFMKNDGTNFWAKLISQTTSFLWLYIFLSKLINLN